jgi:hypothetical protein
LQSSTGAHGAPPVDDDEAVAATPPLPPIDEDDEVVAGTPPLPPIDDDEDEDDVVAGAPPLLSPEDAPLVAPSRMRSLHPIALTRSPRQAGAITDALCIGASEGESRLSASAVNPAREGRPGSAAPGASFRRGGGGGANAPLHIVCSPLHNRSRAPRRQA